MTQKHWPLVFWISVVCYRFRKRIFPLPPTVLCLWCSQIEKKLLLAHQIWGLMSNMKHCVRANLHFCTLDVHRRWFILSECERCKLEYLCLSMVQFVPLVFRMLATEIVSVGIELISLALAEECRKILEMRKKRQPRRWWVKPWIRRREQLGASTQLLVELAAEDSDSYRNHLRISESQLDFLLQKVFWYRRPTLSWDQLCLQNLNCKSPFIISQQGLVFVL